MSGGGKIVPDAFVVELTAAAQANRPDIYRQLFPPPAPPTRRQRLRMRWLPIKWYLQHLGLALLNRCDREGYDW